MSSKIQNINELFQTIQVLKKMHQTIILTNGCFDLLHIGHVRLLTQAKKIGDILLVAVNSDQSIRQLKGAIRPIIPENERLEMIASLQAVDYVFLFNDLTPVNIIEQIKPDIFIKGSGYSIENLPEYSSVKKYGGKVVTFASLAPFSTSQIIEKIKKQEGH